MYRKPIQYFVAVCACLLVLELLTRWLIPEPRIGVNVVPDPLYGHLGPKHTYVELGIAPAVFGHDGFRNHPAVNYRVTIDEPRILFLGDSFTEAWSIPERRIYTQRLERELWKESIPVEVMGFGISDFSTTQELLVYHFIGEKFAPDLVGLQFFALNDFINNEILFANRNQARNDFMRPYAVSEPPQEDRAPLHIAGLGITYPDPAKKWLRDHVHLIRLLSATYNWLKWMLPHPSSGCTNELKLFVVEKDEEWRRAMQTTEKILGALKARVERLPEANPSQRFSVGATRLSLVHFVSPHEVDDQVWEKGALPQLKSCFPGKTFSQAEGERLVRELGEKLGIPTFSLRAAFHKAIKQNRRLFLPDGHFNEDGHLVAAKALAPFYQQQLKLLVPRKQ